MSKLNKVKISGVTYDIEDLTLKSDIYVSSGNRDSVQSVIKEGLYSLSTDDVYTIVGSKANSTDKIKGLIIVNNIPYNFTGSTSSDVEGVTELEGIVTFDLGTPFSISLVDRDTDKINELFIESFTNDGEESPLNNVTITHNPAIGVNKIDYIASLYTEFVHEKYTLVADLDGKQDTLVSGTNIKTINNQSLLGSGNIAIQGGSGATVTEVTQDEYNALVTAGTIDLSALYIITDATPVDLSQYYTSAQTESAITQAVSGKQDTLVSGTNIKTINNESILGEGNITIQGGGGIDSGTVQTMIDESISGKVDTSAVTSSVTSASTNSEIPTAKAVNDKLGGTSIVRLTQAQYDALTTKDPNTVYYITDATPINMSDYQPLLSAGTNITITDNVISAQLEGGTVSRADVEDMISAATSGYVESSAITEEITAAVSGKQDTLVSGTNIKTINNESILGSGNITIEGGGGKAVSGGTNISITTGETADTINCEIPFEDGGSTKGFDIGRNFDRRSVLHGRLLIGEYILGQGSSGIQGNSVGICFGTSSKKSKIYGQNLVGIGYEITIGTDNYNTVNNSVAIGYSTTVKNSEAVAIGYNTVASGTTKTNINNQLKIDTSNQVYIYNKDNTEMICLQDNLGGGSSITVVQTTGTSTTDVMSQDAVTSAIPTVTNQITSGSTDVITSGAVYDAIGDIESLLSNI